MNFRTDDPLPIATGPLGAVMLVGSNLWGWASQYAVIEPGPVATWIGVVGGSIIGLLIWGIPRLQTVVLAAMESYWTKRLEHQGRVEAANREALIPQLAALRDELAEARKDLSETNAEMRRRDDLHAEERHAWRMALEAVRRETKAELERRTCPLSGEGKTPPCE